MKRVSKICSVLSIFCITMWFCITADAFDFSGLKFWQQKHVPKNIIEIILPKIDRRPAATNWDFGKLGSIPPLNYDPSKPQQVDLRGYDLSDLDLNCDIQTLFYSQFDDRTVWPPYPKLPQIFDVNKIIKYGMEPGLTIERVHDEGILGNNVGIAIIDNTMLTEHIEYKDNLLLYEEINIKPDMIASSHGTAVASIAIGKNVGVTPKANLFYIAADVNEKDDNELCQYQNGNKKPAIHMKYYAKAIERVLEVNSILPSDKKIRVLSMSIGWGSDQCYKEVDVMNASVEKAKNAGIFVVSSNLQETYGFKFSGMGRFPLSNPDEFSTYEPGLFYAEKFYDDPAEFNDLGLFVPMDSRTLASQNGPGDYVFYRVNGWSWAIPYIAGVYALALEADPKLTPDCFWQYAMETGHTIHKIWHNNKAYTMGPVLDPYALIKKIQSVKK